MTAEEDRVLGLPPEHPHLTARYGPHPDQLIDIWRPGASAGPRPPVVLVHGGFWRARYDRRHLSPLAAHLAALGHPVALPEYRRVGAGGGFPETCHDITAALDALTEGTAGWPCPNGGRPVVDRRPVVVGHSAGGHLALWAAVRKSAAIRAVVALAPVADLARAMELGTGAGAVRELLGDPARLPEVDPCSLPPPGAPVTVIHGRNDQDVPAELSRRYADASRAAGGAVRLLLLERTGHYALIEPGSPACRVLVQELPSA